MANTAPGNPGIDNTAYLFGVLALAFVFWVTIRGDLPKWLGMLGLGASAPASPNTQTQTPGIAGLPGLPQLPSFNEGLSPPASSSGPQPIDNATWDTAQPATGNTPITSGTW